MVFNWDGDEHEVIDDAGRCEECWHQRAARCSDCGGWVHNAFGDEWYTKDDEGYWLRYRCESCASTVNEDPEG